MGGLTKTLHYLCTLTVLDTEKALQPWLGVWRWGLPSATQLLWQLRFHS
jgi:hypothetical protein